MKAKILVVEDDIDVRESLIMLLEAEGYKVESAEDGLDAITQLSAMTELPNLIVLDWMMPKLNGAQFFEEKIKVPHLELIPMILLTADGKIEEKAKQIKASAAFLKPIEVESLLSAIATHIIV